jgi:lysophospholipase L1-like esterase
MLEWYEAEVRDLENRRRVDPDPTGVIAFYGSSSIRLWSTLASDLGQPRARNLGFGGSTLAACAWFFGRIVVPYQPKSLVVYAGDNDLGDGRSADDVVGSFRLLRRKVEGELGPIPFAFLSIKPSPARLAIDAAIRSVNAQVAADLQTWPGATFIDIYPDMLGPDGKPDRTLYADDGLHLSPQGYAVWTRRILAHRDTIF